MSIASICGIIAAAILASFFIIHTGKKKPPTPKFSDQGDRDEERSYGKAQAEEHEEEMHRQLTMFANELAEIANERPETVQATMLILSTGKPGNRSEGNLMSVMGGEPPELSRLYGHTLYRLCRSHPQMLPSIFADFMREVFDECKENKQTPPVFYIDIMETLVRNTPDDIIQKDSALKDLQSLRERIAEDFPTFH